MVGTDAAKCEDLVSSDLIGLRILSTCLFMVLVLTPQNIYVPADKELEIPLNYIVTINPEIRHRSYYLGRHPGLAIPR